MTTYPVHPVAELFPLMSKDEFRGLVEDIRLHGQHESAVLWQGQLIDGRNRVRACQELGIEPKYCELDDDTDPVAWVVSSNLHRRHLSTGQRSMVASKLATLKHGSNQHMKEDGQNCPSSISDAAKMLNVSPMSVKTAKQVQEHGSDAVKQAVEQGTIPVSLAANLVKAVPDKREQTKLVRQGKKAVQQAVKEPHPAAMSNATHECEDTSSEARLRLPRLPSPQHVRRVINWLANQQALKPLDFLEELWAHTSPHERQGIFSYLECKIRFECDWKDPPDLPDLCGIVDKDMRERDAAEVAHCKNFLCDRASDPNVMALYISSLFPYARTELIWAAFGTLNSYDQALTLKVLKERLKPALSPEGHLSSQNYMAELNKREQSCHAGRHFVEGVTNGSQLATPTTEAIRT